MPFKRTRDLINFNAGIVHSHCRHWLQHCISLIHHLQIGITQNVIWWLPGWNGNLFWLKAQPSQTPKFSKFKWFLTLSPNQDMHFIGKIKAEAHTNCTSIYFSHKKSPNRNLFFKKIFKLFVAYGKVPWAWKVEGGAAKGFLFCFALLCERLVC